MMKHLVIFCLNFFMVAFCDRECGLKNIICDHSSKYRTIDGSCNNLKNPNWGTKYSIYDRILPPKYGDGKHSFTKAQDGKDLPNARLLSYKIFTHGIPETISNISLGAMQYGQIVTHDMSFTYLPVVPADCCTNRLQFLDQKDVPEGCSTISIPADDPFYSYINATCISMPRTVTNRNRSCLESLKYEEQLSIVNNYLDLSLIYGQTYEEHKNLRSFKNGELLVDIRNNHQWLPPSKDLCSGNLNSKETCYRSGDPRVNQNLQLLLIQTLWVRNHNNLAINLKKINPHWNDEKLFQEARRINIAEHQFITYYEMLPLYLEKENLIKKKILYQTDGFVNDYDDKMRPHVFNEHAQGAFRQFHSTIAGKLGMYNPSGCPYDSLVLRDHFNRPGALEKYKIFDGLIRGLAMQPQMESDIFVDPEVTRQLFMGELRFGIDLKAIDIQRNRDHGLGSYNDMRAHCGMKKATHFEDFLDVMDKDKLDLLLPFYKTPDDVDLVVGGSMERNTRGTLAGPTFLCIIYQQFYRTRRSDRFWFENESNGLTLNQLNEIRKFSISKLFCNNGNDVKIMQKHGFLPVSRRNPRYSCKSIHEPNLHLWKD